MTETNCPTHRGRDPWDCTDCDTEHEAKFGYRVEALMDVHDYEGVECTVCGETWNEHSGCECPEARRRRFAAKRAAQAQTVLNAAALAQADPIAALWASLPTGRR